MSLRSLEQRPRDYVFQNLIAESAPQNRGVNVEGNTPDPRRFHPLDRAFSAHKIIESDSWGVAPGY